jgi:hypothetical protein
MIIRGYHVGTVLDKELGKIYMRSTFQWLKKQGIEVGVPGCHIVRKIEERREIHVTRWRERKQWSKPLLVLGCNIGAMLDEESCKQDLHGPSDAQWSDVNPSPGLLATSPYSTRPDPDDLTI